MSCLELVTTVATLIALAIAIYQSVLARRSLEAAKKSIDEDKRARQLSIVPKMSWVIEVQMRIDAWLIDLNKIRSETKRAVMERNEDLLKKIATKAIVNPVDIPLRIDKFVYENMPDHLVLIMMSGAQYYYDAVSPTHSLWTKEKGGWWEYANSIDERYIDSINALEELKRLISEMVPAVLLETPASIDDRKFIHD